MPYSQVTWQDYKRALYHRLGKYHFWTDDGLNAPMDIADLDHPEFINVPIPNATYPEISGFLREALLVWGSMAFLWKERITLTTTAGEAWYDLRTVGSAQSLFAGTLTELDLLAEMQHHLLEPVDPTNVVRSAVLTDGSSG